MILFFKGGIIFGTMLKSLFSTQIATGFTLI